MDKKERVNLYIPTNIKTKYEYIEGYGSRELITTILATIISALFAIILYQKNGNTTLSIFIVLVSIASSIILTIRDKNNQSMLSFAGNMIRFFLGQKKYDYNYESEWE